MTKKMNIPSDWSELKPEHIHECLTYLAKNYKKYKITKNDDKLYIGKIAKLQRDNGTVKINRINIRNLAKQDYDLAIALFNDVERRSLPFNDRVKKWWRDGGGPIVAVVSGSAVFLAALFTFAAWADKKDQMKKAQEREQFKQEIINEVLEHFNQAQNTIDITTQQQKVK